MPNNSNKSIMFFKGSKRNAKTLLKIRNNLNETVTLEIEIELEKKMNTHIEFETLDHNSNYLML